MNRTLEARDVLHVPPVIRMERDGVHLIVDADRGNWVGTDPRGAELLSLIDGARTLGEAIAAYARTHRLAPHEAQAHAATFYGHLERRGVLARAPLNGPAYEGRAARLSPRKLRELWLHTNNSCNLTCAHCLVSSGPEEHRGAPTAKLLGWIDEGLALGVEQFFFTGGEPFVRPDIFDLIERVTTNARLIVLTNGLLFHGARREALRRCDREKLGLQISLDGATAATNDPIRGAGTFEKICAGIRAATEDGFRVTVTAVATRRNAHELSLLPPLIASLGAGNLHLLWPHARGRALDRRDEWSIDAEGALAVLRNTRAAARAAGVTLDNWESFLLRVGAPRGLRHDLSNAGYESLCIYSDGEVYPSAALANLPEMRCGSALDRPLREVWQDSPVLQAIRRLSVIDKPVCRECPVRFVCGGGDIEHSYHAGEGAGVERMRALDPYCELYKQSYLDAMVEQSRAGSNGRKTGFSRPVPLFGLGDGLKVCKPEEDTGVAFSRSACVLSVDLDAAREPVRRFYSEAAQKPQKELCCPTAYPREDTSHIPQEVLDIFYGCGSPVAIAGVREGETVADLGSGGGIDCFIAARKVGAHGRVFGIDMTDAMLGKARANAVRVAENLGYANVEFRKGFLEEIPLPDATADLILSNCVINLSPDKPRVFGEMWRVLKDFGRIVVSDVVADRPIPLHLQVDSEFRGQCLGGALTQGQFVADLERAGFYGIHLLERTFWKEVHGIRFFSVSVRAHKFEKKAGCTFIGQWAVYLGPFHSVLDDEGHLFPRNEAVEVCTDTAGKLAAPPYAGQFVVFAGESAGDFLCCGPDGTCC